MHLLEEAYQGDLLEAMKKVVCLLDGMYAIAATDGESVVAARTPSARSRSITSFPTVSPISLRKRRRYGNGHDTPVRLNPGDLLRIDDSGPEVHEGFHLQLPQIDVVDFREAVETYKDAVIQSVHKRLNGLNESRLASSFPAASIPFWWPSCSSGKGATSSVYCTGTEDSGDIIAARAVADDLGLPLKTSIIDETLVESILPDVIREVEESGLLQVEVAIPMYLAARLAAEDHIRVMYTGQPPTNSWPATPGTNDVLREHGYLRLHENCGKT